jgi:hypothetical protein
MTFPAPYQTRNWKQMVKLANELSMAAQIPSGTIKAPGIAPRPGFSQLVASARSNKRFSTKSELK